MSGTGRVSSAPTMQAGEVLARVPEGSEKPGRWLWAEDDTLATIAVYADACHVGDTGAWTYLLDALGDLLPGTRPATAPASAPSVDSLVGADPGWTGALTTAEYVQRTRCDCDEDPCICGGAS